MSIVGLGNDIVSVDRIRKAIQHYGKRFLNRIFTKNEQAYCLQRRDPALHFAGRFAAKEAVVKAFGTGFSQGINWTDIEIINDGHGKPFVACSPDISERFGHPKICLSISHCHEYATAIAIWEEA